jgi:hypothetical protein
MAFSHALHEPFHSACTSTILCVIVPEKREFSSLIVSVVCFPEVPFISQPQ